MWGLDFQKNDEFYHTYKEHTVAQPTNYTIPENTTAPTATEVITPADSNSTAVLMSDHATLKEGDPTNKCIMYTIIFETFIFLQIFNEFNCRCISPKKYNMFSNLLSNWLFLAVILATSALTIFFVEYGGKMTRTASLDST